MRTKIMDEALTMAEKLKKDIKNAAIKRGINHYKESFKPRDLGLDARNYGSFADFCSPKEAKSGKWRREVVLKVKEWLKNGKPRKYILL